MYSVNLSYNSSNLISMYPRNSSISNFISLSCRFLKYSINFDNILCIHDYFSLGFRLNVAFESSTDTAAIAEAKPVGVAIGVVLDTLDNLVSIDSMIALFQLSFYCRPPPGLCLPQLYIQYLQS